MSVAEFERRQEIRNLIQDCACGSLKIQANQDGQRMYLQVSDGKWTGRKWMLSPHMTDGEVVQTALAAVLAWYEHEAREAFKFRGKTIFNPHLSLETLCGRSEETEIRKETMATTTTPTTGATLNVEQIARVCHEANRAYCESIGDTSQLPWQDAAQWQRDSAMNGVNFKLGALHRGETLSPAAQHEAWLADKARDGWKYGPTKNVEAKEHPCFVPYHELPAEQKVKDFIFVNVVRAFFEAANQNRG